MTADLIKCIGQVYRTEVSSVSCFDILVNNITNSLYGVKATNSLSKNQIDCYHC